MLHVQKLDPLKPGYRRWEFSWTVGTGVVATARMEEAPEEGPNSGVIYLEDIKALDGRGNQGHGGHLLEELMLWAQKLGFTRCTLHANAYTPTPEGPARPASGEQERLVQFYQRHGFAVEEGLRMSRRLDPAT